MRDRSEHRWTVLLAMAAALAGCAADPDGADYTQAPTGLEGLFEVSSHEVQLGCEGEPTPVAELPMEEAPRTTKLFVLLSEPGDFGGTQLVALACDDDQTCDVENELRKYYDLEGVWKFALTRGSPNEATDGCDLETWIDTLETDNGGDDIVMELRVTAGSEKLRDGETGCTGLVRDTEPDDLPCVREERIVASRIKE